MLNEDFSESELKWHIGKESGRVTKNRQFSKPNAAIY